MAAMTADRTVIGSTGRCRWTVGRVCIGFLAAIDLEDSCSRGVCAWPFGTIRRHQNDLWPVPWYPRLGHTLKPVLEDVLDRVAAFLDEVPRG